MLNVTASGFHLVAAFNIRGSSSKKETQERLLQKGNSFLDISDGRYQFLFRSGKGQADALVSAKCSAGNKRYLGFMDNKLAEIIRVVYGKGSIAFPKEITDVGKTVKRPQRFVYLESRDLT